MVIVGLEARSSGGYEQCGAGASLVVVSLERLWQVGGWVILSHGQSGHGIPSPSGHLGYTGAPVDGGAPSTGVQAMPCPPPPAHHGQGGGVEMESGNPLTQTKTS